MELSSSTSGGPGARRRICSGPSELLEYRPRTDGPTVLLTLALLRQRDSSERITMGFCPFRLPILAICWAQSEKPGPDLVIDVGHDILAGHARSLENKDAIEPEVPCFIVERGWAR